MIIIPRNDTKRALKLKVYQEYLHRVPARTQKEAFAHLASRFGISVSTVKRFISECTKYNGVKPPAVERRGRTLSAWDEQALEFFKGFLFVVFDKVGKCSVRSAYRNTVIMAQQEGWLVGSEPSAYVHAKQISPALMLLAKGGTRALDNMFYIARNLQTLRPFQVVVGDQHRFDFWCRDKNGEDFRPECYMWLDMRTRLVYGISFDKSYNTRTVLRSLKMGVERFGKFECTYNDNGSSEKSAVADYVVENLLNYGMRFEDESELYKTAGDSYIVEDGEGNMINVVPTRSDWQRSHRRIFANVKNAKTKPIERFFSTLEQLLQDRCLPGLTKPLNASAPEEEQAQKRLDWQKKNNYILNFDEFVFQVKEALNTYESRVHATLGHSPIAELEVAIKKEAWQPTMIAESDIFYLFCERSFATVQGDRVRLGNVDYVGPPITKEMILQNRGTLVGLNRQKVELRYDSDNLELGVWAIDPRTGNAIALKPVKKLEYFDTEGMKKGLKEKRANIRAITAAAHDIAHSPLRALVDQSVFKNLREASALAANANKLKYGSKAIELPEQSTDIEPKPSTTDSDFTQAVAKAIGCEEQLRTNRKPVFQTKQKRYESILEAFLDGKKITQDDLIFKAKMEADFTDSDHIRYEQFIRLYTKGV